MRGRLPSPLLLASVGSLVLLLGVLVGLLLRQPTAATVMALPVTAAPAGKVVFPAGFGALAELVPFAGGVAPVAAEVATVAHAPEFRDAVWLQAQPATAFTVQVMAARDEEGVKRFLATQPDRERFQYFQHVQDGVSWYVVVTGSYASLELARGIVDSQDYGAAGKAFPRQFSSYQAAPAAPAPAPGAESSLAPVPSAATTP